MGMYWKRCGIRYLVPHCFLLSEKRFQSVSIDGITIEGDCIKACLLINFPKSGLIPIKKIRRLGFNMDLGTRYFNVRDDRWEAIPFLVDAS
jgi:hypothetical protein